jgi:hypothetical protein
MANRKYIKKLFILFTILFTFTLGTLNYFQIDAKAATVQNAIKGTLLFEIESTDNMQGVAYANGYYYVSFDVGNGYGVIRKYTEDGKLVQQSPPLLIGHSSEIEYREKNGNFYVSNGGGTNPTKINEVNFNTDNPYIVKTLDLSELGNSALVAVDNYSDTLVVHTAANDKANPIISIIDFNGNILNKFSIKNQGVPQGIAVKNSIIYYYTNNSIVLINFNGQVIGTVKIQQSGESEGITVAQDGENTTLIYGYNKTNRLFKIDIKDIHREIFRQKWKNDFKQVKMKKRNG